MSRATRGLHLDSLTIELEARGLSTRAAEALSAEFVLRHPFAQRLGMNRLVSEIENRGVDHSGARGTAAMLIGIELRDRGAAFERVLSELQALGLDRNDALASALSSARVYREICRESRPVADVTDNAVLALAWFGLAILALSICLRLAS
jgi:hypothetical protein